MTADLLTDMNVVPTAGVLASCPVGPAAGTDAALHFEVEQLLYTEARLLDAGRFDEWLALYAADALYWVPSEPGQTDPVETVSIIYEDVPLLRLRIQRLAHPRAYALSPRPRTVHQIGNVTIAETDAAKGRLVVASTLTMLDFRESERRSFGAAVTHHLRREADGLRIAGKRVDLIDCDGAHGIISIPF